MVIDFLFNLVRSFFAIGDAIWGHAEWLLAIVGAIGALYLLLNNVLRRESLKGYIKTVIVVLIDREAKKILVCYHKKAANWILPQGKMHDDVEEAAEKVLFRELGMQQFFSARNAEFLGSRLFKSAEEKKRLARWSDPSEWMLSRVRRGKTYVSLVAETQIEFADIELYREIAPGKYAWQFLYGEIEFVDLRTAKERLSHGQSKEKAEMYKTILAKLEEEFNKKEKKNNA